jgi:hypothetical protein
MSYQYPGQYEAKAFSFEEFTQIFRNSFLLHILYAGYGASISWTLHALVFSAGTDSDKVTFIVGVLSILAFLALGLAITDLTWKRISERREIAFLIEKIKMKYDTTGMVFNDHFQHYRRLNGTRKVPGTRLIDVVFVFHSKTNEPMFLGSEIKPDFEPQILPHYAY